MLLSKRVWSFVIAMFVTGLAVVLMLNVAFTPRAQGEPVAHCFENPEVAKSTSTFEGCGYPGQNNTGVTGSGTALANCEKLTASSSKTISKANETVENTFVTGEIVIQASGVKLKHDCVEYNGGETSAIRAEGGNNNAKIEEVTVIAPSGESYDYAISADSGVTGMVATKVRAEDCIECITGSIELLKSYVNSNGDLKGAGLHREDWYGNNSAEVAKEDTLLNPEANAAVLFDDTNLGKGKAACKDKVTVENSILAGGQQSIQLCGKKDETGSSLFVVKNTRFARCVTSPYESGGEHFCAGSGPEGSDEYGYFPYSGSLSAVGPQNWKAGSKYGTLEWSGNYWDNNLEALTLEAAE